MLDKFLQPDSFMITLEPNQEYLLEFDAYSTLVNLSYESVIYNLAYNDYIIIKHKLSKKPDYIESRFLFKETLTPLNSSSTSFDWYWNENDNLFSFIIANREIITSSFDVYLNLKTVMCFYPGCKIPEQPELKLPVPSRPKNFLLWSNPVTWTFRKAIPTENDSVVIPVDMYIVVDTKLPILKSLEIQGVLEFDNNINHTLEVDYIFVNGGELIIGWENDPILTDVNIILRGEKNNLEPDLKSIKIYGRLEIHGRERKPSWTRLSETVYAGTNIITLEEPVDWQVGETIVITTTSYHPNQTETGIIKWKSANNKTLILTNLLEYDHVSFWQIDETKNKSYLISAGVGLLTKNVKIIGKEYTNQTQDLYGFKILVSNYSKYIEEIDMTLYYQGYARLSGVEFIHPGQYSRGDSKGYGVLFQNVKQKIPERISYIVHCSFHHGYAATIATENSSNIIIGQNVIYHTIDSGILIQSNSNFIVKNMVCMIFWASSILKWQAKFDQEYKAAIDLSLAESYYLESNFVAGAERIGILFRGTNYVRNTNSFGNNSVYSSLSGVVILPSNSYKNITCLTISGFTVFKSSHWGIYYQDYYSVIIESNILIDNQVNIMTLVIGSSILNHVNNPKIVLIQNMLIVGQSNWFNALKDKVPDDLNYRQAKAMQSFGAGENRKSKIGIVWPYFIRDSNGAPIKPWSKMRSFSSSISLMTIREVTFINFNESYVFCSNPYNEDLNHKIFISQVSLINVSDSFKIWLYEDKLRTVLLEDSDGSFLSAPGSVISETDKSLEDFNSVKNCVYRNFWQAYECSGVKYIHLRIESLDFDFEPQTLIPILVFYKDRYVDINSSLVSHQPCYFKSCLRTSQTFFALLEINENYRIYFNRFPPNKIGLKILNSDLSKVQISIFYPISSRIDLYSYDNYVEPTNSEDLNGTASPMEQYIPSISSSTSGANFFHHADKLMYLILDGHDYVTLVNALELSFKFEIPANTFLELLDEQKIIEFFFNLFYTDLILTNTIEINNNTNTTYYISIKINQTPMNFINEYQLLLIGFQMINKYRVGELQTLFERKLNLTLVSMYFYHTLMKTGEQKVSQLGKLVIMTQPNNCREQSQCEIQPKLLLLDKYVRF